MVDEKKYIKAKSLENALELAFEHKQDFKFIAGGTDVLVNKFQGNENTDCLIDLSGIAELKTISKDEHYLKIGAWVTLNELQHHPDICYDFEVIA